MVRMSPARISGASAPTDANPSSGYDPRRIGSNHQVLLLHQAFSVKRTRGDANVAAFAASTSAAEFVTGTAGEQSGAQPTRTLRDAAARMAWTASPCARFNTCPACNTSLSGSFRPG